MPVVCLDGLYNVIVTHICKAGVLLLHINKATHINLILMSTILHLALLVSLGNVRELRDSNVNETSSFPLKEVYRSERRQFLKMVK